MLTGIVIGVLTLSSCGVVAQKAPGSGQSGVVQAKKEAANETLASGPYWRIEVSDTKNFTYTIPNVNGGTIDMTATLHFIAWKEGGEEMFGKYKGRALVAFDMDLSKAGADGVTFMGGAMDDSISDNISFVVNCSARHDVWTVIEKCLKQHSMEISCRHERHYCS